MATQSLLVAAVVITSALLIAALPLLAAGITILLVDREMGTMILSASQGGDPVVFQHLFGTLGIRRSISSSCLLSDSSRMQ
jgi:cytochrome c oxidase subunit 1